VIEETLASIVERFNRHAEKNPGLTEELRGIHRTIAIRLADGRAYGVELKDGRLTNLVSAAPPKADVTIRTDAETFVGLARKEIGPMKALVTRKLAIDGSLDDKLLFRKLLQ
jgi:putative sterol carrier protein